MTGEIPVGDLRMGIDHFCGSVAVEDRHIERHWHEETNEAFVAELIEEGQIGGRFNLGTRIEEDGGVAWFLRNQGDEVFFRLNAWGVEHSLGGSVGRIDIAHIEDKAASAEDQDGKKDAQGTAAPAGTVHGGTLPLSVIVVLSIGDGAGAVKGGAVVIKRYMHRGFLFFIYIILW